MYAATKKANELMAHTYSHLFKVPCTGLRFFTVYGPWGRPDMAMHLFTSAIMKGEAIDIFNHGEMSRDFTYVDDVVESVLRVMLKPNDNAIPPMSVFNVGRNEPQRITEFISEIENQTNKKASKNFVALQPGDVVETYADSVSLFKYVHYQPTVTIKEGVSKFVQWFKSYYEVKE
jgi:UDP-glucuronate 4-epimerase